MLSLYSEQSIKTVHSPSPPSWPSSACPSPHTQSRPSPLSASPTLAWCSSLPWPLWPWSPSSTAGQSSLCRIVIATKPKCPLIIRSVKLATQVQNIFCSCKLIAVAIIIGGGIYMLYQGSYDHVSTGFKVCSLAFLFGTDGIKIIFIHYPGNLLGGWQDRNRLLLWAVGV